MKKFFVGTCVFFLLTVASLSHADGIDKKEIEAYIKSNPNVILDVLKEHPITTLQIVQKGSENQRILHYAKSFAEQKAKGTLPDIALADRIVLGNPNAAVKVVFFTDFLCHFCEKSNAVLMELAEKLGDKICIVYKAASAGNISLGRATFQAFYAAKKLDSSKVFEYCKYLFDHQNRLGNMGEQFLDIAAEKIGYDRSAFEKERAKGMYADIVNQDFEDSRKANVTGTPVIYFNNIRLNGYQPLHIMKIAYDVAMGNTVDLPEEK